MCNIYTSMSCTYNGKYVIRLMKYQCSSSIPLLLVVEVEWVHVAVVEAVDADGSIHNNFTWPGCKINKHATDFG